MTTILVIVVDVQTCEPDEMPLAKDDHVLEELAPTVPDPPFSGAVLPWASKRSANGLDAERPDALDDGWAEDGIAV